MNIDRKLLRIIIIIIIISFLTSGRLAFHGLKRLSNGFLLDIGEKDRTEYGEELGECEADKLVTTTSKPESQVVLTTVEPPTEGDKQKKKRKRKK